MSCKGRLLSARRLVGAVAVLLSAAMATGCIAETGEETDEIVYDGDVGEDIYELAEEDSAQVQTQPWRDVGQIVPFELHAQGPHHDMKAEPDPEPWEGGPPGESDGNGSGSGSGSGHGSGSGSGSHGGDR